MVNKHTRYGSSWEIPCDLESVQIKDTAAEEDDNNELIDDDELSFDTEAISRTYSIFQHDGSGLIPVSTQDQ